MIADNFIIFHWNNYYPIVDKLLLFDIIPIYWRNKANYLLFAQLFSLIFVIRK